MVKKGRHRRYEEARALKRNNAGDDIESLMDRLDEDPLDLLTSPESDSGTDDDAVDGYQYEEDKSTYTPAERGGTE